MGKGFSISLGIKKAKLPILIIQDADLEYSPFEYTKLAKPIISQHADVVYGSRYLPSNEKAVLYFWHKMGNNFLTLLSNVATNLTLTDMETCLKMMKSDFAKRIIIQENRFGIEPEITAKLAAQKARFYEVPISYHGRTYEEGKKITWKDGFSAIFCILKYNRPKVRKYYRNLI
jgi:glycosyltransferase involved in cell wall biosynthesis